MLLSNVSEQDAANWISEKWMYERRVYILNNLGHFSQRKYICSLVEAISELSFVSVLKSEFSLLQNCCHEIISLWWILVSTCKENYFFEWMVLYKHLFWGRGKCRKWRIDLRWYFAGNREEHFSHAIRAPDLVSVDSEHARQWREHHTSWLEAPSGDTSTFTEFHCNTLDTRGKTDLGWCR